MNNRNWLHHFSKRLSQQISSELVLSPVTRLRAEPTETGGFYVVIGRLRGRKYSAIELWLDVWTHSLRLYYGLVSSDDQLMIKLQFGPSVRLRPALRLSQKQVRNAGTYAQLIKPLPSTALNRPIFEAYKPYSFHGFYTPQPIEGLISSGRIGKILLNDVADGVVLLARTANGILTGHLALPSAFEEHKRHQKAELWLRSHKLAEARKQRDGYTCQVCRFHAPSTYKDVPSTVAVEAHHLRHLSAAEDVRVTTSIDDLITVCANCHKVLHQLGCTPARLAKRLLAQ